MTVLTVFTIPKAFKGCIKTIQFNAIGSWLQLEPACEVLLFGNEEGTVEAASQLGVRHIPEIDCNAYGTPLVSCAFRLAQKLSSRDLFCYVNADVILVSDFVNSLARVEGKSSLVLGRRWDVDLGDSIDFNDPSWEPKLLEYVQSNGVLHRPRGLDYFVFPRGLFEEMPPFVVGRAGWDNWMVLHARLSRVPVVDATRAITAIHQNHDYSHLPEGEVTMRNGAEAQHNLRLLGGRYRGLDVRDATHILTPTGVRPAVSPARLLRRLEKVPELYKNLVLLVKMVLAWRAAVDLIVALKTKLRR
jgi:hypothetical protein